MRPTKSGDLYIVRKNEHFVYWCAWRYWLATRCGRTFIHDTMTVWLEWPPADEEEVRIVVEKMNESRRVANEDTKIRGRILPMLADNLDPFQRWSTAQILDYERRHREDPGWLPSLTGRDEEEKLIPMSRVKAVIEATYHRYRYGPKYKPPPKADEPGPAPPRWHSEEQFRQMRLKALGIEEAAEL